MTAEQARHLKPAAWWAALRQLFDVDRKIRLVSGLRMAHVAERLWLRIFSPPWGFDPVPFPALPHNSSAAVTRSSLRHPHLALSEGERSSSLLLPPPLPPCFKRLEATCCVARTECCCPVLKEPPAQLRDAQRRYAGRAVAVAVLHVDARAAFEQQARGRGVPVAARDPQRRDAVVARLVEERPLRLVAVGE